MSTYDVRGWRCWWLVVIGLLACGAVATPGAAVHPAAAQPTAAAQDEFVPIGELPVDEELAAAPLVLTAYAVAWLIVMLYLWSIWQRLSRVEREMHEVARRMAPGRPDPVRRSEEPVPPTLRRREGGPVPPKL